MDPAEEARLLRRIAQLSGAINSTSTSTSTSARARRPTRHRVYVRPSEPAAPPSVAAAVASLPPVHVEPAQRAPVLRTSFVRPKEARSERSTPIAAGHRVAVFGADGGAWRKTSAHTLERSEPKSNRTLVVPRPPRAKPVCAFFLRGECARDDCPYAHVNVAPDAEPCADFVHGHCPRGLSCMRKHVYACEYSSEQCPRGADCILQHRNRKRDRSPE